jgi:5-methylthioadenosine/S-adenosylhomocysteine deaminase
VSHAALLAGRVLVQDADVPPLRDAALLVEDGTVVRVGPASELRSAHPDADYLGHHDVLLPGLIDAHSHARGTQLERHGVSGGPLERFLIEIRAITPLDPGDEALVAAAHALATGVTTMQPFLHTFAPPDGYATHVRAAAEGLTLAGVRAGIALGITDRDEFVPAAAVPPGMAVPAAAVASHGTSVEDFIALVGELASAMPGRVRIDAVGPVAPQWCSDEALARIGAVAGDRRVHTHLLESERQRRSPLGDPLDRLDSAGLVSQATSVAHCVWLDEEHAERLAARRAVVVHCPGSNTHTGVGACPVRWLRARGVTVGFGLDSHTLSSPPDAFTELRNALRVAEENGEPIHAREALRMFTRGSAAAVCRPELGVLDPGSAADVVALRQPEVAHSEDPVATLVAHAGRESVTDVWVGGERVFPFPAEVEVAVEAAQARLDEALRADAGARARRLRDAEVAWEQVDGLWRALDEGLPRGGSWAATKR